MYGIYKYKHTSHILVKRRLLEYFGFILEVIWRAFSFHVLSFELLEMFLSIYCFFEDFGMYFRSQGGAPFQASHARSKWDQQDWGGGALAPKRNA